MKQHYLGITGITSMEDVEILRTLSQFIPSSLRLMAGVLVSHKTLRGKETPSKRYPVFSQVPEIVTALSKFCWPVIHYNTQEKSVHEIQSLFESVSDAGGIQLNIVSPPSEWVEWMAKEYPEKEIILQVNRSSYGSCLGGTQIEKMGFYIQRYQKSVHHALLDLSGGAGKLLDPSLPGKFIDQWEPMLTHREITLGTAGGLGPDCASVVHQIFESVRGRMPVSLDAETQVRIPHPKAILGEKHQDKLDYEKSLVYIQSALCGMNASLMR